MNSLFFECSNLLELLLNERKLKLPPPICSTPQQWFALDKPIYSAVVLSVSTGQASVITKAWGVVFVDSDKPQRCTNIHSSLFGESVVLRNLLKELKTKQNV